MWRPLLSHCWVVLSDQPFPQPVLEKVSEGVGVISGENLRLLVEDRVSVRLFQNQLVFKPIAIANLFVELVALLAS